MATAKLSDEALSEADFSMPRPRTDHVMTDEVLFYTNPMSRGRVARWMLEETGAPYRAEIVKFGAPAPEFSTLNPMAKVPVIVHRGMVVTEGAAICAYLADAFPDAGLAPPPAERGSYYRWMFFAAGPLEAAVTNRTLGVEVPADRQGMVGYGTYARTMDALEAAVTATEHIAGDRFTAADVYVGSHIGWGLQWGTVENRDAFAAYWKRISDREAYRRAAALDNTALKDMHH
jgi:glutathione S-transferase